MLGEGGYEICLVAGILIVWAIVMLVLLLISPVILSARISEDERRQGRRDE